jgi:1-acyl-sn-glycerol-3-phosphate acyltransferase
VGLLSALLFYPFALAVILLTFPLALLVRLVTWPFDPRRMATSRTVRALGEILVRAYPFWRVEVEGSLPPSPATFVVVPNHRSMADAVAVACLPREMKWMGKRSAFRFPWLGWSFSLAGYVPVLRGDRASGQAALARLRRYLDEGVPVGVFAEGTRSREGDLGAFRAGPFALAIDAGVPVVPVAISGAGRAMPRGRAWVRASRIRVRVLDAVPTAGLGRADVERLRDLVRARMEAALAELDTVR